MTLVKYNPFRPFKPVGINQILDELSGRSFSEFFGSDFVSATPSVNVIENDDSFTIEVAAPGLAKEDFKIELENNNLTISASKETSHEDIKEGKFARREFNYNSFKRSFHVSEEISADSISASYADGILSIRMEKREKVEDKKKKIEIA